MALPSESWGSTLSADPGNELQAKCSEYLHRKMKTRTTLVKFCKGPYLLSLYQFMQFVYPELNTNADIKIKKQLKKEGRQEKAIVGVQECVTYCAINHTDKLCEMTIDFLIEIVACFLQKLALTTLPRGGIYIGGGVSNYICEYIQQRQDIFWKNFLDHTMFSNLWEIFPYIS